MNDIKEFLEKNIKEELIYETSGQSFDGCLESIKIQNNKLRIVLNKMEIIIDNIINNLSFMINDNELSISNNEGIHIFYII